MHFIRISYCRFYNFICRCWEW